MTHEVGIATSSRLFAGVFNGERGTHVVHAHTLGRITGLAGFGAIRIVIGGADGARSLVVAAERINFAIGAIVSGIAIADFREVLIALVTDVRKIATRCAGTVGACILAGFAIDPSAIRANLNGLARALFRTFGAGTRFRAIADTSAAGFFAELIVFRHEVGITAVLSLFADELNCERIAIVIHALALGRIAGLAGFGAIRIVVGGADSARTLIAAFDRIDFAIIAIVTGVAIANFDEGVIAIVADGRNDRRIGAFASAASIFAGLVIYPSAVRANLNGLAGALFRTFGAGTRGHATFASRTGGVATVLACAVIAVISEEEEFAIDIGANLVEEVARTLRGDADRCLIASFGAGIGALNVTFGVESTGHVYAVFVCAVSAAALAAFNLAGIIAKFIGDRRLLIAASTIDAGNLADLIIFAHEVGITAIGRRFAAVLNGKGIAHVIHANALGRIASFAAFGTISIGIGSADSARRFVTAFDAVNRAIGAIVTDVVGANFREVGIAFVADFGEVTGGSASTIEADFTAGVALDPFAANAIHHGIAVAFLGTIGALIDRSRHASTSVATIRAVRGNPTTGNTCTGRIGIKAFFRTGLAFGFFTDTGIVRATIGAFTIDPSIVHADLERVAIALRIAVRAAFGARLAGTGIATERAVHELHIAARIADHQVIRIAAEIGCASIFASTSITAVFASLSRGTAIRANHQRRAIFAVVRRAGFFANASFAAIGARN